MARIRPETGFETTLSQACSPTDNTLTLATVPTETIGYLVIEPGTANKEVIKYTGVSGSTVTGVTRGLALTGSSDGAGTGKSHSAGKTVSMTNVHHYLNNLVHKDEANTWTADQTFETALIKIGDGSTDEDEYIYANNGDASNPFIRYDAGDNKWLMSNNGVDTFDPSAGGSGLTAGNGIVLSGGAITYDPTDDGGTTIESGDVKVVGVQDVQTAGETISGATTPVACYLNNTDNQWYACDANDQTKLDYLGFAITDGTDNNSITIQFSGIVGGFTGLNIGTVYYVQDDKTLGTTRGTYEIPVGIAVSATELAMYPPRKWQYCGTEALSASNGSASTVNDTSTAPAVANHAVVQVGGTIGGNGESFNIIVHRYGCTTSTNLGNLGLGSTVQIACAWSSDTITVTLTTSSSGSISMSGNIYYYT